MPTIPMATGLFNIITGATAVSYFAANGLTTATAYKNTNDEDSLSAPSKTVSVIMCGYNEDEGLIERSIISLKNNSIVKRYPGMFEFIYVGEPDIATRMYEVYNNFDMVIAAPKGRLTAKNMGISYSNGEILVLVDADKRYGYNWLNKMIAPFNNPTVVATTCATVFNYGYELAANIPKKIVYSNRLDGGNSAYLKTAYYKAGGFNELVNQNDWGALMQEEEVYFKKRMEKLGKIVFVDVFAESGHRLNTVDRIKYNTNEVINIWDQ